MAARTDAELISNYYQYTAPRFEGEVPENFTDMNDPAEVSTLKMGIPVGQDDAALNMSALIVSTHKSAHSDSGSGSGSDSDSSSDSDSTSDDEFSVHTFGSDEESDEESDSS